VDLLGIDKSIDLGPLIERRSAISTLGELGRVAGSGDRGQAPSVRMTSQSAAATEVQQCASNKPGRYEVVVTALSLFRESVEDTGASFEPGIAPKTLLPPTDMHHQKKCSRLWSRKFRKSTCLRIGKSSRR